MSSGRQKQRDSSLPSPNEGGADAFVGTDVALVAAFQDQRKAAAAALYRKYAGHVERILVRVMGADAEIPDIQQDVFIDAVRCIGNLREPDRLKAWLTQIAVNHARQCILKRTRRKWLLFVPHETLLEMEGDGVDEEARHAVKAVYKVLDKLPANERIAFALRYIEGMALAEVAHACDCSLATIKRRLAGAHKRFTKLSARHPELSAYVDGLQEGGPP